MYYGLFDAKRKGFWETAEGHTDLDKKTALMAKAQYFSDYGEGVRPSTVDFSNDPIGYFKEQGMEVVDISQEFFLFLNLMMSNKYGSSLITKEAIEDELLKLKGRTEVAFIKAYDMALKTQDEGKDHESS